MNGEGVVTAPTVNKDAVMHRADEPVATAEAQHRLRPGPSATRGQGLTTTRRRGFRACRQAVWAASLVDVGEGLS